jgi:hypothetical protein
MVKYRTKTAAANATDTCGHFISMILPNDRKTRVKLR